MSGFPILSLFWPSFFVVNFIVQSLVQWGRRKSLDGTAAAFVGPGSFKELSIFPHEQQKRLLHEADKHAFSGWRFLIPSFINAALFSGSVSAASAVSSYSYFAGFALAVLFYGLTGWLACRWEARIIRPYLKDPIDRTRAVA